MSMLLVLPLTFFSACASHYEPGPQAHSVLQERKAEPKDAQSAELRYQIVRRAVQGASQKDFEEWPRLWATIKARATETDPPSRVSVRLSIESTDARANALLNSFVKRELRSMKHVTVARDPESAHCVIHIKALVARPKEDDALYFLSFLLTQRYVLTDEGISVHTNIPSTLSEKDAENEEQWAAAANARLLFRLYIAACQSTIYVPVAHDATVVTETELKKAMELTLAKWDSEIFEPTVENIRGIAYMADALGKVQNAFQEEIERREREGQGDKESPAQPEGEGNTEP